LIQQLIHYFLTVAEIRALEPREGFSKVDQASPRCQTKDAKSTGNVESLPERNSGSFTLINQDEICV
jgi:hypothetical protein